MTNIARTIPHLTKVIMAIEEHAESNIKYEDAPYVVEVILPCVCSYLSYWWSSGPQKIKQSIEYKIFFVPFFYQIFVVFLDQR
jgi:hypothetical protein